MYISERKGRLMDQIPNQKSGWRSQSIIVVQIKGIHYNMTIFSCPKYIKSRIKKARNISDHNKHMLGCWSRTKSTTNVPR